MTIIAYNEKVAQKLTKSQWSMFMERAFPELKHDYNLLQQNMKKHEWDQVKKLVHKLTGIVQLLGMDELLNDLEFISQLNKEQLISTEFQNNFKVRYSTYLSAWESSWLASVAAE